MTLYEYNPFFGYLEKADEILGHPNYTTMRGERELLSDVLALDDDDKDDIELSDYQLRMLDSIDLSCFHHVLKSLNDNEKNIHFLLKYTLNNYEDREGYPLEWIHYLLNQLSLNRDIFDIFQQTYIETFLTQSLVNIERNPYRKNRITNPYTDEYSFYTYDKLKSYFMKTVNSDMLLTELKESFPIEKGKDMRIIIDILIEYKILVIPYKKFKSFYELFSFFIDRNIGTYNSIHDCRNIKNEDIEIIRVKIDNLLKRIS
jgi:hypothetical protein